MTIRCNNYKQYNYIFFCSSNVWVFQRKIVNFEIVYDLLYATRQQIDVSWIRNYDIKDIIIVIEFNRHCVRGNVG